MSFPRSSLYLCAIFVLALTNAPLSSNNLAVAANEKSPNQTQRGNQKTYPIITPKVTAKVFLPKPAEITRVTKTYGSLPGGLVFEGRASGLKTIRSVRYNRETGQILLNTDLTFTSGLPAPSILEVVRAINRDERFGVSIADDSVIAYGAARVSSETTRDLALADVFLVDFIVSPRDWTLGYKTAGRYKTATGNNRSGAIAFYKLKDFDFRRRGRAVYLSRADVDINVVPVLTKRAPDGGYLPDLAALARRDVARHIMKNARHMGRHINYYLEEKIAGRALAYGAVAALLRAAKADGADLDQLERDLLDRNRGAHPVTWGELEWAWRVYLRRIQQSGDPGNWSFGPSSH